MASPRKQRVAQCREDIEAGRKAPVDTLFRALYGTPTEVQIELARYMTARYLPVFRSHRSDLLWIEEVLAGVDDYFSATGEGLPEPDPDDIVQGDVKFMTCLFGLSWAWKHAKENQQGKLTAACGAILINAVGARADNVWRADDPVAVHAFETCDHEAWQGRTSHFNVASQAVRRREWLIVADWLDEHDVGGHPDTSDEDAADCERWLAWWRDREYLL